MLLHRRTKGWQNNKDPTTIYKRLEGADLKTLFGDLFPEGEVNQGNAETLSAVTAAHRIFTDSIATMPWMVRRREGLERYEASHPVEKVLKIRANEYQSPAAVMKVWLSQAFWFGTGYLYIGRNRRGEVEELIPLPSEGAARYVDPASGAVWYGFSAQDERRRLLTRRFQPSELMIYHFQTYDGINGRGILDLARETIATDISAQRYNQKFYKTGANISGIITVDGEVNEDAKEIIREDFERFSMGMDNAFRTAVLDLGMKYTPIGVSQRDSQFIEGRTFAVDEIARFTGIPQYMLQTGKQTYESNEQQRLDFVVTTLMPHVMRIEQEANLKLLGVDAMQEGYYLKQNEMGMLRGDDKSRAEYYEKMIQYGIYCPDECRALEDKAPLPDGLGAHYWMSKNYDMIQNIMKGGDENGN